MTVRIVTDSTSDLPPEIAGRQGITVVPAYINIGERSFLDGVDLTREAFYESLPDYEAPPTTAAPSSGAFAETYERLAAEGGREILSIHIAGSLSGMMNAARLGAEAAESASVSLFDSEQLSMGLGLLAIVAAEAAKDGCSVDEIRARLAERVERTYVFATLDTLEYLRRSGRVSWAQFGLGTLLSIKPLVKVYRGQVEIPEKVRTGRKARRRIVELVEAIGPLERVALLHTHANEAAESFGEQIRHLFPPGEKPVPYEVTPAIGAHAGPGAVGLACIAAN